MGAYAEEVSSDDQPDKADQTGDTDEDAVWREIVENYGERVHLDDLDGAAVPAVTEPSDPADPVSAAATYDDDLDNDTVYVEDVERYEPPAPPPLPSTTPDRLLAWVGLLGTPVIVIALVVINWVLNWAPPTWLVAFLVLAFLGGFGYLVYSMSNDPDDPWDDGARL